MKFLLSLFILFTFGFSSELKIYYSYDEAVKIAKIENKDILMFVYSERCPWCHKMENKTLTDKKVIDFINDKYVFIKINKDKDIYPRDLEPRFLPTTYLLDKKTAEEKYAFYGFKTTNQLIEELNDDWDIE